ncbi:pyridoxamine 5'-phosphate oxidase family protein [Cellulomonas sp. Leaf334]|uniref:pyridoxamine 5'-phosphate oxidase family protein n=1 Tax=Cellulomonas sp. Leaf334 TaxID=1736339 RepID=UPI0006FFB7E9|nr:pyridoxamine 5'-phosphate oxidase family protein [Cellulomonas sp. Leaf334]KQR17292.1 hypothetical protein ASF78_08365 [Cellulomonas sp. Leaf334]
MARLLLDDGTPAAAHLSERLTTAPVIWLATVDGHGRPHAVPVWFVWADPRIAMFTPAGTAKVRHVRANPAVALHLDTQDDGGRVITLSGAATLDVPDEVDQARSAFAAKYEPALGGAPISGWFATFDQPVTVEVERIVSWTSTPTGPDVYVVPTPASGTAR